MLGTLPDAINANLGADHKKLPNPEIHVLVALIQKVQQSLSNPLLCFENVGGQSASALCAVIIGLLSQMEATPQNTLNVTVFQRKV